MNKEWLFVFKKALYAVLMTDDNDEKIAFWI